MGRWYHQAEGEGRGPLNDQQLAALFRSGVLTPESLVRADDEETWSAARERLPDLALSPPPVIEPEPTPPSRGWTDTAPHPWRRYFARVFDNLVLGAVLWMSLSIVAYLVDPETADRAFSLLAQPGGGLVEGMITLILLLPAQVLMIGTTGLSPGKWVFGVRVLRDGRPIGLPAALVRELTVWIRGLAFGVPLVSLATLAASYRQLADKGAAPWDEGPGHVVVHRRAGAGQVLLMTLAVTSMVALIVALKVAGGR